MGRPALTSRGVSALALGLGTYAAAWLFGARALYPPSLGLLAAVALAWLAVRLTDGPMRLHREVGAAGDGTTLVEGADVGVALELRVANRLPAAPVRVGETIGMLGERETTLRRSGGRYLGRYVRARLPRGRYAFERTVAVVEDPLGLVRREVELRAAGAIVVVPRLVEVERPFNESGAGAPDRGRLLRRRPSGFDVHSVREYERGESLRKVHWRSTAKRGQLMVRQLEDALRDDVAVVLDASAQGLVGPRGDSSFDAAVRAAGSLLATQSSRNRRAALIVTSTPPASVRVGGSDGDWRVALGALASAEATGTRPVAALLSERQGSASQADELVVVTSLVTRDLVDAALARAATRRAVAIVHVDAASFSPSAPRTASPAAARLALAGIPLATVRRGEDLARALSAPSFSVRGAARA